MNQILIKYFRDCEKATLLLRASLDKYVFFEEKRDYTPEELEPYDALSSRFERLADVMINALFKSLEQFLYGQISQNIRDVLLRMEKSGFIDNAEKWFEIRLLRNKIAHAYLPEERISFYNAILTYSKDVFNTTEIVRKFLCEKKLI